MRIELNEAQTSFLKSAVEKMQDSEIKDIVESKLLRKKDIEQKIERFLTALDDMRSITGKYTIEDDLYPDYAPNFSSLAEDLNQYFLAVLDHGTID